MHDLNLASLAPHAATPKSRPRRVRHAIAVWAMAFCLFGVRYAAAATVVVSVKNNVFSPPEVSIVAGDTVRWQLDQGTHTTTSSDGLWDSGILSVGSTFEYTFNNPGDFAYVCSLHIRCCNMAGTVHVAAPVMTRLLVSAPANVTAGVPFDLTVTAVDENGNAVPSYAGTVTFTSSDPYPGVLPTDYTFTAADQGMHTFAGALTFFTAGPQTVMAQDTGDATLTSGATVAVSAAPANQLSIAAASTAVTGVAFDVMVLAVDPYGNVDTNYAGTVTWTTSDADPGVLLPADYTFQAADSGGVLFAAGVTLITLGDQTLVATDTVSGITGSATVTVGSAP